MRGLVKAAALLSSHLTSALVIPDATALEGRPSDPIVEYGRILLLWPMLSWLTRSKYLPKLN